MSQMEYFLALYKNKLTVILLISPSIIESGKLSHTPSVAIIIKSFSSTLNDVTDARSGLNKIQ
jgi:hypothetical protein